MKGNALIVYVFRGVQLSVLFSKVTPIKVKEVINEVEMAIISPVLTPTLMGFSGIIISVPGAILG